MNALRDTRLRRDLNNVASQVQDLLDKLGDEGSERLDSLRDRMSAMGAAASSFTSNARDKFAAMDMRGSARQAAKVTDEYVRDNPWRAIGVGAALGLLIGYLVSRR
jgi:ElaB/YqjD/DUF883 family membrane-anchored ribosome-binding protein